MKLLIDTVFGFVLFSPLVLCDVTFNLCKSVPAMPDNKYEVSGCNKIPCPLKRNTTVDVEIHFTPEQDSEKVVNHVYIIAMGLKTPFPGIDGKSACKYLSLPDDTPTDCPLKGGQEYKYKIPIFVKPSYPKAAGLFHWALRDKKGGDHFGCFEFDGQIL